MQQKEISNLEPSKPKNLPQKYNRDPSPHHLQLIFRHHVSSRFKKLVPVRVVNALHADHLYGARCEQKPARIAVKTIVVGLGLALFFPGYLRLRQSTRCQVQHAWYETCIENLKATDLPHVLQVVEHIAFACFSRNDCGNYSISGKGVHRIHHPQVLGCIWHF